MIEEVIADHALTMTNPDHPVEVVQGEEPGEEEAGIPEWIRNPCVKIIVIPRRWIVCDNRRTFLVVITVYYRWVRFDLAFSRFARTPGPNCQIEFSNEIFECIQGLVLFHRQLFGICCSSHSVLQLADNIGCYRVIGDPSVSWLNSDGCQHILSLCLAGRCS